MKIMSNTINYIKHYGYNSIFFKYLKKILVIIIIPLLVLNVALGLLYEETVKNRDENTLTESFRKTELVLSSTLEQIENNHIFCSSNILCEIFMLSPGFDPDNADLKTLDSIRNMMIYFKNTNTSVQNIYLYSYANKYVISTEKCGYEQDFSDRDWMQYAKAHSDEVMFTVKSQSSTNDITDTVTFCYKIYFYGKEEGLIAFSMDSSNLSDKALSGFSGESAELALYYDNKKIYTSSDNSQYDAESFIAEADQNYNFKKADGRYIFYKKLNNVNYSMSVTYPDNISAIWSKNIIFIIVIMIITTILISVIMAVYLSCQNYNSTIRIIDLFNSETDSSTASKNDEISFIINNIQNNIRENNVLEQSLSEKIIELKKAQLMSVQLQLTPHFLFNTLNHISITMMAITKGNNKASDMISLLSDILSYALDTETIFTSVSSEIEQTKKYIEIESIKHNNSFTVNWEYDDNISECMTPKLILQPIIENAVTHGINELNGKRMGKISISIYSIGDNIIFEIADNGIGIEKQTLDSIRKVLEKHIVSENKHIGLSNVNQKIYLLFGDGYGISISSNSDGTTVFIKIPKQNGNG